MELIVRREVAAMQPMRPKGLRAGYAEVFGETTSANNKTRLTRHIAWRLQALAQGGPSERRRRRAEGPANGADLRMSPPRFRAADTSRGAAPAAAVARAITGSHRNDFLFFRIAGNGGRPMSQANRPGPRATLPLIRCAISTRKSTEEGLEQESNNLDARRVARGVRAQPVRRGRPLALTRTVEGYANKVPIREPPREGAGPSTFRFERISMSGMSTATTTTLLRGVVGRSAALADGLPRPGGAASVQSPLRYKSDVYKSRNIEVPQHLVKRQATGSPESPMWPTRWVELGHAPA
jgi:hypothetical protein